MTLLSVNVDHVATLRQARGTDYPDPLEAAWLAEAAGAEGITVHLRSDRRHIQDEDVRRLRSAIRGKLNLEMAITGEMLERALEISPHQVTLVPERPEELTTEGGLDVAAAGDRLRDAAERLTGAGIAVSVFVDPDRRQVESLRKLPRGVVAGYEINTDHYTRAGGDESAGELANIAEIAAWGAEKGLEVYAGHGLTTANVGPIAALGEISELNIGHAIVSRAVLVGMERAVREMRAAMTADGLPS